MVSGTVSTKSKDTTKKANPGGRMTISMVIVIPVNRNVLEIQIARQLIAIIGIRGIVYGGIVENARKTNVHIQRNIRHVRRLKEVIFS